MVVQERASASQNHSARVLSVSFASSTKPQHKTSRHLSLWRNPFFLIHPSLLCTLLIRSSFSVTLFLLHTETRFLTLRRSAFSSTFVPDSLCVRPPPPRLNFRDRCILHDAACDRGITSLFYCDLVSFYVFGFGDSIIRRFRQPKADTP